MNRKTYPFLDLGTVNSPYSAALKEAARRVIDSGRYVGGAENEAFEAGLCELCHTPHAVGVSNGLDALRLIFRALIELGRLAPGDGVIVPANTYIASVLAVTDCGLRPVFVEPDPVTLNLDTSQVDAACDGTVKAVLTVHLYGRACFDSALAAAVRRHGLTVVEDNAQAIGADAAYPGLNGSVRTGSLGHAAACSFYPTKNLGALGDAGAVTTADTDIARTVRALANYGSDRRYHNIYEGFNCRLDPIQAAFMRVKLPYLEGETAHRRAIAAVYDEAITNPLIVKPLLSAPDGCVWHQYVVRTGRRDDFLRHLEANGVGYDIHYAV
ncbi:MAG: DegT/DnrJ/EryC1/StrS family aminotransferase, partial [Muribaculaceae bacterium]|nr:DegT/DnrJ/EryC1/StrS family aminotransferase [Muribaculaceae bacterium]